MAQQIDHSLFSDIMNGGYTAVMSLLTAGIISPSQCNKFFERNPEIFNQICNQIAINGDIKTLQTMMIYHTPNLGEILQIGICTEQPQVIQIAQLNDPNIVDIVVSCSKVAATYGAVKTFKFLRYVNLLNVKQFIMTLLEHSKLTIIQQLYSEHLITEDDLLDCIAQALSSGNLNAINWFKDNHLFDNAEMSYWAVKYDHFDILEALITYGYMDIFGCSATSAQYGDISTLNVLYDKKVLTSGAYEVIGFAAITFGQASIIGWLINKGQLNIQSCKIQIEQFDVMQFLSLQIFMMLYTNGVSVDASIFSKHAATHNRLDLIECLKNLSILDFEVAEKSGTVDVKNMIHEFLYPQ